MRFKAVYTPEIGQRLVVDFSLVVAIDSRMLCMDPLDMDC